MDDVFWLEISAGVPAWLNALCDREVRSGVPVFYYPRYLGVWIMWEPKTG